MPPLQSKAPDCMGSWLRSFRLRTLPQAQTPVTEPTQGRTGRASFRRAHIWQAPAQPR